MTLKGKSLAIITSSSPADSETFSLLLIVVYLTDQFTLEYTYVYTCILYMYIRYVYM